MGDVERYLQTMRDKIAAAAAGAISDEARKLSDAQKAALQSLEEDPADTGHLEASCVVVPGRNNLEVIVQAGGELTTVDGYDHAEGFEYGTSRQHARPFFWPTYRAKRDEIRRNVKAAIERALR